MKGVSSPHAQPALSHPLAATHDPHDEPTGWEKTGLQLLADIEVLKATLRASRRQTIDAEHRAETYRLAMLEARGLAAEQADDEMSWAD